MKIVPTTLLTLEIVPWVKGQIRGITVVFEIEDENLAIFEVSKLMETFFDQDLTMRVVHRLQGYKQVIETEGENHG